MRVVLKTVAPGAVAASAFGHTPTLADIRSAEVFCVYNANLDTAITSFTANLAGCHGERPVIRLIAHFMYVVNTPKVVGVVLGRCIILPD